MLYKRCLLPVRFIPRCHQSCSHQLLPTVSILPTLHRDIDCSTASKQNGTAGALQWISLVALRAFAGSRDCLRRTLCLGDDRARLQNVLAPCLVLHSYGYRWRL